MILDFVLDSYDGECAVREGPSVLVIADRSGQEEASRAAVEAIGGRVLGVVNPDDAAARLEQQISMDAVLIDCPLTRPVQVLELLSGLGDLSGWRPPAIIVASPFDQLDGYTSLLFNKNATVLCEPEVAERAVALHLACMPTEMRFYDNAGDMESMRLRRIADEVGRIAKALSSLSEPDYRTSPVNSVNDFMIGFRAEPVALTQSNGINANEVRTAIRLRRLRDQFFPADLFADPAWDMLLDLFAARLEDTRVAVSSLCIAAAVPPTTALRWIKHMTDDGLLERIADPDDGRRIFIRLSNKAAEGMARYWAAMRAAGGLMV